MIIPTSSYAQTHNYHGGWIGDMHEPLIDKESDHE